MNANTCTLTGTRVSATLRREDASLRRLPMARAASMRRSRRSRVSTWTRQLPCARARRSSAHLQLDSGLSKRASGYLLRPRRMSRSRLVRHDRRSPANDISHSIASLESAPGHSARVARDIVRPPLTRRWSSRSASPIPERHWTACPPGTSHREHQVSCRIVYIDVGDAPVGAGH
jgi:hypothetical protein